MLTQTDLRLVRLGRASRLTRGGWHEGAAELDGSRIRPMG